MSNDTESNKSLIPHAVLASIFIAIIASVLLWPGSDDVNDSSTDNAKLPAESSSLPAETVNSEQPDTFTPPPTPEEVVIEGNENPEPQEPVEIDPTPIVDASDAAIKSAILSIAQTPVIGRLLVNDSLLQRFVVTVTNIANESMAPNHDLVVAPENSFRIYQQADREWIDPASYKRYNSYVDALDSLNADQMLTLYQTYLPTIQDKYEEIGNPDEPFSNVLVEAINELLDTPEIPTPVEVYSDSVMYKYKDEKLEQLSAPQKQLLRTGPDNMRRIKAKLRELKEALADGSE